MKKFLFLFLYLFLFNTSVNAGVEYTSFIDQQLKLVYQMNENNITQEKIKNLMDVQELAYDKALNVLMKNKNSFIKETKLYDKEIFSLKKIMFINKRAGNTYAVLRDEIKVKSYRLIRYQNIMLKEILLSLDKHKREDFEEQLNNVVSKNQQKVGELSSKDYSYINNIDAISKTLLKAKKNLREFYALKEINADMINNIYKLKNKMYRLNKYTHYHLIGLVVYINTLSGVKEINPILETYGLSIIKISLILFLIGVIYFFRKVAYVAMKSYLLSIELFSNYAKEILEKLYKPIDILVIIININMIFYVYNDFSNVEIMTTAFNIIYGFFFTFVVYKTLNTVASIKISEIDNENRIKNEMINVGIKIINFIIIIIGLLIMLYLGGVNLTAVLSGLGIGGFAVAFAARDTISNFFGTLSILFSDVFSQGDWIVVGKDEGVVVEIGLRVTTLRTFDNAMIAIPNGTFATSDVKNWTKRTLGRRIKMRIGVKYDSKSKDIKNAVAQIRTMLDKHPGIATVNTKHEHRRWNAPKLLSKDDHEGVKKTLLVYLDEFGPSSMNILIYCFTKTVRWQEWLEVKEDVMHNIMEILENNSLEFAFPSLSIYNETQSSN
ncbi:MAG: mechanosensitive ion channel family protein [Sulfurimonas sp.]